jgi:hypothetical protein
MTAHAASHIAQARMCLTLALEHLAHAAIDAGDRTEDVRTRIAAVKNQESELEWLQRNVEPSLADVLTSTEARA